MYGSRKQRIEVAAAAVVASLLLLPVAAEALQLKTNRGGVCVVNPLTVVQGDQVTYGLDVGSCRTRNGIQRIASQGLAIEGIQIVSALDRKFGTPPYRNIRTSDRLLPTPIPGLPLPDLPLVPDLPELPVIPELPIDIPALPELPLPGMPDYDPDATYTRIDFSVQLARDQGKRAKRKPEKWRNRAGCDQTTRKRTADTLVCQSFAATS